MPPRCQVRNLFGNFLETFGNFHSKLLVVIFETVAAHFRTFLSETAETAFGNRGNHLAPGSLGMVPGSLEPEVFGFALICLALACFAWFQTLMPLPSYRCSVDADLERLSEV